MKIKEEVIKKICEKIGVDKPKLTKINIGFTNELYSINNKFILKICTNKANEKDFLKEVYFYQFFRNKIPVPT